MKRTTAAAERRARNAWANMRALIMAQGMTGDRAHAKVTRDMSLSPYEQGRLSSHYYRWSARKRNPKGRTKRQRRAKASVSYDTSAARHRRKTNPVIMLKSQHLKRPAVCYYDGAHGFVRKLDDAKTYDTKDDAKKVALKLLEKFPVIRKWDVYIREGK